jgi:hypothetical protein
VKNQGFSNGNSIIMWNDSPSTYNEQFTMHSFQYSLGGNIVTSVEFQIHGLCINDNNGKIVLGNCGQTAARFYVFCSACGTFTRPCKGCYNFDGDNESDGDTGPGGTGCLIVNLSTKNCMINSANGGSQVVSSKCNAANGNQLWSVIPALNSEADIVANPTSDTLLGIYFTIADVIQMFF